MYLNKAIILGNLTRDPELRALPSGVKVTSFGVATNRVWKDKNGVRQEDTQFHNVVVFGSQADIVAQYLKKGSTVLVEGRLQTRSWDNQQGQRQYRTEIVADRVQFGPRRSDETGAGRPPAAPIDEGDQVPGEPPQQTEANPDDIPF